MGVPKYRRSKSEKCKHRTHWKRDPVTVTECPRCREPKLPHRVCPHCGTYRGMEVIEVLGEE